MTERERKLGEAAQPTHCPVHQGVYLLNDCVYPAGRAQWEVGGRYPEVRHRGQNSHLTPWFLVPLVSTAVRKQPRQRTAELKCMVRCRLDQWEPLNLAQCSGSLCTWSAFCADVHGIAMYKAAGCDDFMALYVRACGSFGST